MTPEELERYFQALPPSVLAELNQRLDGVRAYIAKANTVRTKIREDFPMVDRRVATVVGLAIARFL
jgi:hypothetical protein